jgi:SnoaL-like domain
MTDVATVVDGYIAMWNEPDPERRRAIIAETWTEDATYVDPIMSGEGPEGISAMVAGAQAQFPGHRFELTAGPDAHHDRVRFAWKLVANGSGAAVAAGVDFATLAADGRLQEVTGFLEPAAG